MRTESEVKARLVELKQQEENCYFCKYHLSHPACNPHWPRHGEMKALEWALT